jgi:hypothetical protein
MQTWYLGLKTLYLTSVILLLLYFMILAQDLKNILSSKLAFAGRYTKKYNRIQSCLLQRANKVFITYISLREVTSRLEIYGGSKQRFERSRALLALLHLNDTVTFVSGSIGVYVSYSTRNSCPFTQSIRQSIPREEE